MMKRFGGALPVWVLGMAMAGFSCAVSAGTVTVGASEDTTLFSQDGNLGNGAGGNLFAGNTSRGNGLRRSPMRFDLAASAIPVGALVTSVDLTLYADQSPSFASQPFSISRLTATWGEGTAVSGGGSGDVAGPTDATWTQRFHDAGPAWTVQGGDFSATPSATTNVGAPDNFYHWQSPQMTADVQGWLNTPATNFGWILIGNETVSGTAKRFVSSEGFEAAFRPSLTIIYNMPAVPEPATYAMLGAGLGLIGLMRFRRRNGR